MDQWTWKPSPRPIGFDADENGQSWQIQRQIPIHLYEEGGKRYELAAPRKKELTLDYLT
jgi:hypothetical protein